MPLDTRIALTGQPLQLESPIAQYGQLMSVVNAGTQNQLAQMQISAAQRAAQEDEGLKNYLAKADLNTAEGQRGVLQFGAKGQALLKSFVDQAKDKAQTSLYSAQADELKYKSETQKLEKALNEISNFSDAASALASIDTQVSRKIISPEQATQLKAQINAAPDFSTWQRRTVTGMMAAKDRLDILEEQRYLASRVQPAAAAPAAPAAAVPTLPVNDAKAPLVRPTQAAVPLDKLTVSEDARGDKTYYLDGVPIPGEKFAELLAVSAASPPLSGTRTAFLASMAPAVATALASAPAAAPMAPAAAAAPASAAAPMVPAAAPAPAAPPDMANALALKIQGLQEERNKLVPFLRSSSAKTQYEDLGKQIDNLSKGFSVSAGGAYTIPGVGTFERPAAAPTSADITTMKALGYPITQDGFKAFTDAKRQDRLLTPEEEAQKKRIAKAGASSVSVNAGQKAEDVELGKYVVDQYKDISTRADVATRSLPALDINLKTLEKGFDTGFGTETIAAGAKVLAALGVQNAKDFATDSQTFLANANSAVLQKQLEQKGVQTAADADRITSTGAQLGNTKEANKFILSVAKAQLQRDIAQRKFYSEWRDENKTFKGAEDAWYAGPGGASLFDSPILKKYAEPVAGQAEARKVGLDKIFKKAP
jgi:hypothetical protein